LKATSTVILFINGAQQLTLANSFIGLEAFPSLFNVNLPCKNPVTVK
jgi:hypothetical protein